MSAGFDLVRRSEQVPEGAEFGIRMDDDSLAPVIKRGETVYARSRGRMSPGDVGLFLVGGELMCRQYAEDSEGNIYLFTLDREKRDNDLTLPPDADVILYARLILPSPIPLPGVE